MRFSYQKIWNSTQQRFRQSLSSGCPDHLFPFVQICRIPVNNVRPAKVHPIKKIGYGERYPDRKQIISHSSANEKYPDWVIIRWYITGIPIITAASFSCLVILLAASLGSRLPPEWLWAKIREVAYFSRADYKTSRKSITIPVMPPPLARICTPCHYNSKR